MNKKLGLRMAQGGLVQGDERAALYAKYGIKPGGNTPAPQPTPQPVAQAPAPVQKPQAGGLLNQATSALTGRRRQLEEAMNYAEGGIVRGKGGPTDDEVPMQVAGKNVNLSNTEAVLPAKTVQALGGPKAVEALIEQTNGKPPVKGGLRQGGSYYSGTGGDTINPKELRPEFRGNAAGQPVTPAANAGAQAMQNTAAQAATNKMPDADPVRAQQAAQANAQASAAQRNPSGRLEQPSRSPAAPGASPAEQSRWGKVKKIGLGAARGLNAVGAVASGGADIANANEPAEQAVGALKMSGALPGWAGVPGKIALYGDQAVKGMTGKSVAQWADKAAQLHPDYMLDKEREWGTAGTRGDTTSPTTTKPTTKPTAPTTPAAQPEVKDFDTNLMNTLGVAAQQNDGRVNFNSQKDATEYNPAPGTGIITRQPGKDGLRSATFVGGPSAADAARDKQFAEAGYGKDAYGNWMTPSRIADQQKVAAIEARDAKAQAARDARDAENYKAMQQDQANRDPNSTLNSMREDSMISDLVERTKYGKRSERANATAMLNNMLNQRNSMAIAQQRMAHEGGLARERMGHDSKLSQQRMEFDGKYRDQELGLRAQEIGSLDSYRQSSLQNDAQKNAASAKAAAQSNYLAASKEQREMVGAYLDKLVPTTGLKGDDLKAALSRRAQMEEAFWKANGGNMSLDPQQLQRELGSAGDAANLTLAKNEAVMNPSLSDRVRNLMNGNKDRNTTMYSTNTVVTEDGRRFNMPGGPSLRTGALGPNADLLAKQEQINQQYAEQERLRNLAANQ